jgi:hypothetical protein
VSSEAAKKAYPDSHDRTTQTLSMVARQAFDRGAVEALRQVGDDLDALGLYEAANVVLRMEQKWVVGQ